MARARRAFAGRADGALARCDPAARVDPPSIRSCHGHVAAFLSPPVPQPEVIETHDTGAIARVGMEASGSEDEILERLRALGYIE